MSTPNAKRGMDATSLLSGGLAVLITLPVAPRIMEWTSEITRQELINGYGPELAEYGMMLHAVASVVVSLTALYLAFNLCLRVVQQKLARAANAFRR